MIFNRSKAKYDDQELIQKFKETKKKVWVAELWNRYVHLVYGVCLKYLKNEVRAQDETVHIFEKLFTDLLEKEVNSFDKWIYVVSKNHCLMFLRKDKKWKKKDSGAEVLNQLTEEPVNTVELEEKLVAMETAMESLIEEQKVCLDLFYLKERSYKEVAELTGYELSKVKSHIQNGKRNLKNQLSSSHGH